MPTTHPSADAIEPRFSPVSLTAALLASAGVAVAAISGIRWLTIALAGGGAVAGMAGVFGLCGSGSSRRASLAGGMLAIAIVLLAVAAPAVLNPFWGWDQFPVGDEPARAQVVPRNKARGPGRPVEPDEWLAAATDGVRQGDLYVQIQSVKTGRLPDKGTATFLLVNLRIDQWRDGLAHQYERFVKGGLEPKLTDDAGREYAFIGDRVRKSPTKFDRLFVLDRFLVFEPPADTRGLKLVLPGAAWGQPGEYRFRITEIDREPQPDLAKQIADTKAMLRRPAAMPPDRALGRALFARKCQECHTLFGIGGKTGPDLTASKRSDLDFLLTSIIDPSAVIEKKYQATIVVTNTGYVHNGIVQKEDAASLTLLVPSRLVVVPRDEIEEMRPSSVSLMPTDLLKDLTEHEVRSIAAYLTGTTQAPMLATAENIGAFFPPTPGLATWRAAGSIWTVDNGVLAPPLDGTPSRLASNLLVPGDFQLTMRFNPGAAGQGGVLVADAEQAGEATGVRVSLSARSPVTITQGGIAIPGDLMATAMADGWNKLEVTVAGDRMEVRLNDRPAAAATVGGRRRAFSLDAPGGEGVRFRSLGVRLIGLEN